MDLYLYIYVTYFLVMPKSREQKINRILQTSLKILSAKGYENATIADIAKALMLVEEYCTITFQTKKI